MKMTQEEKFLREEEKSRGILVLRNESLAKTNLLTTNKKTRQKYNTTKRQVERKTLNRHYWKERKTVQTKRQFKKDSRTERKKTPWKERQYDEQKDKKLSSGVNFTNVL